MVWEERKKILRAMKSSLVAHNYGASELRVAAMLANSTKNLKTPVRAVFTVVKPRLLEHKL